MYLWIGGNGLLTYGTKRPEGIAFFHSRGPRFGLYVDERLALGSWVGIGRNVIPPWRLAIRWQTMSLGGSGDAGWV